MVGIVAVLVIVGLSLLLTRLGAAALEATGVSRDLAHFQARSAFTGVGYTTDEAESITGHPGRRRVILTLMLLGNAGIVSVVTSLVLTFIDAGGRTAASRLGVLGVGLLVLWYIARTERFDRLVKGIMRRVLRRWTDLEVRDYVQLLHVSENYAIRDLQVDEGDWLAGGTLRDLDLAAEGALVLGIRRANGEFIGAPGPDTTLREGDTVMFYGRQDNLDELGDRPHGPTGDAEHRDSVARHDEIQAVERARDESAEAHRRGEQRRSDRDVEPSG